MKKRGGNEVAVVLIVGLLLIWADLPQAVGDDHSTMSRSNQQEMEPEKNLDSESKSSSIIDAAKSLFYLPTYYYSSYSWPFKLKELFHLGRSLGPLPNLDFRSGSSGRGRDEGFGGEEGATERVKEAVVKSLDESKTTVEDSAKSAAKFAEKAMDETLGKMKRTFSRKTNNVGKDHESEEL